MRERYIDIVKGLSILCITLLHYVHNVFPNEVNVFVGSFMITSFYVTSGWVSAMHPSQRSLKEFIKNAGSNWVFLTYGGQRLSLCSTLFF